jgi:hypothetical protein
MRTNHNSEQNTDIFPKCDSSTGHLSVWWELKIAVFQVLTCHSWGQEFAEGTQSFAAATNGNIVAGLFQKMSKMALFGCVGTSGTWSEMQKKFDLHH